MAEVHCPSRQTFAIVGLASLFSLFLYSYPSLAKTQTLNSPKHKPSNQQENILKCGYRKKEISLNLSLSNLSKKPELQGNRVGDINLRCGDYQPPIAFTALMPASNIGFTLAKYPTFLFYIPDADLEEGVFVIKDEKQTQLYKKTVALKATDSVISVDFSNSPDFPPLEVGKSYFWEFLLIVDQEDRSGDVLVSGWIKRIEPNSELKQKLDSTLPQQQPAIYAANGIWYEALGSLAKLRCSSPNDSTIASDWTSLLEQVGLPEISRKPLAPCS